MSHSAEDIEKRVRGYVIVGASLLVLTGLTVAVAFLEMPVPLAITVALINATFKASLVAAVFMHLISEKKLIYSVLLVTAAFFLVRLFVPLFTSMDGLKT